MRYRLAHYRECRAHREWNTTCPACGRRGKFVPYIDTVTMRPVDDHQCGRCNRLSNCGYHLPPRAVKTHPNPPCEGGDLAPRCQHSLPHREGGGGSSEHYSRMRRACNESQPWGSHLVTWLRTQFPKDEVAAAIKRYRVGGTPDGATLWWQVDSQGRVHTGKAMQYNPLTGHRVKSPPLIPPRGEAPDRDAHTPPPWGRMGGGPINWAHRMRLYGEPTELVVGQCLFGEHLMQTHPNPPCEGGNLAPRCQHPLPHREGRGGSFSLVESEKTALILSILKPDTVWLATGGKANLKESMLAPLIGLDVALYPDADALHQWYTRAVELNRRLGTRLHIPTWYYNLMDHDEARREGWDLADVILCSKVKDGES